MTDNSGKTEGQTPTTEETTSFTESLRDTWDEVHVIDLSYFPIFL